MNPYWLRKADELNSLAGLVVTELTGIEMAVQVSEADEMPIFGEDRLPFVQLTLMYLKFADGSIRKIEVCTSDDSFGIVVAELNEVDRPDRLVDDSSPTSIFRRYTLDSSGLGRIEKVTVKLDEEGCVLQLDLRFHSSEIALVAGEVIDEADGSLRYCRPEESILLFPYPKDVGRIPWFDLSSVQDTSGLT